MIAIDTTRAERQAAGQDLGRAGLDPRGQQATNNIIRSVAACTTRPTASTRRRCKGDVDDPRAGARRPRSPPSAFAPLANRSFLAMWIANLMSNVGGWMQTTAPPGR